MLNLFQHPGLALKPPFIRSPHPLSHLKPPRRLKPSRHLEPPRHLEPQGEIFRLVSPKISRRYASLDMTGCKYTPDVTTKKGCLQAPLKTPYNTSVAATNKLSLANFPSADTKLM